MRRLLIMGACLIGLGWLVWLLWRKSAVDERVSELEPDAVVVPSSGPDPEPEVDPELVRESFSMVAAVDGLGVLTSVERGEPRLTVPEPQGDIEGALTAVQQVAPESYQRSECAVTAYGERERRLAEVAQIRSEVLEKVEWRPLFVMAEDRGVPHFRLFFMTKQKLLEAILDAEQVPPADVLPSPETVERVRALAHEAFRRNDEFAAEEAFKAHVG